MYYDLISPPWANRLLLVVIAVAIAYLSYLISYKIIVPIIHKITKKTEVEWDDILFNHDTLRAVCRIVPAIVIWVVLPHIFKHSATIEEVLARATAIYITIMTMRLGITFVNSLKKFEGERRTSTQQYFHTFCGVIKIVIFFVAIIVSIAIAIGKNPLTLFAGLGAASAVLMLVFKDVITGLVAGIRLTSNKMLHKGDWITVSKAGINGIVEDITLTTVKVRNFDNTILTIPPQSLVEDSFQNWQSMRVGGGRRVTRKVYFDFESIRIADHELKRSLEEKYKIKPEDMSGNVVNMTLFRRYMEKWIQKRDDVNDDMLFMVRQMEPTQMGLPVEFYFFLKQKDWKPYEQHMAEIMENIFAIAPDFGLKIFQVSGVVSR